ncbi:NYN domain-containing protein, partial [Bacillus mycoides]|uniref:NYN domain-containing protein n=1 Tax=Bacillus mycoides TaxID=1405 RepID=UPI003CC7E449
MIVFHAYTVQRIENKINQFRLQVIFTTKNQTPHQKIHQLPIHLPNINTQIYLPTSHYTHHSLIFPQPPLTNSPLQL